MEKLLSDIQLGAILRLWSIHGDKDIPLAKAVEGFNNNIPYLREEWLKRANEIHVNMRDDIAYDRQIAAMLYWHTKLVICPWKTELIDPIIFESLIPIDQKFWLDEANNWIRQAQE